MKSCSICHNVLPDSSFNKRLRAKCGLRSECRDCQNSLSRGYDGPTRPKIPSTTRYLKKRVNGNNVCVHRHIMETIIGRPLDTFEYVHHINGNSYDNRPENLQLVTPKEHSHIHKNL